MELRSRTPKQGTFSRITDYHIPSSDDFPVDNRRRDVTPDLSAMVNVAIKTGLPISEINVKHTKADEYHELIMKIDQEVKGLNRLSMYKYYSFFWWVGIMMSSIFVVLWLTDVLHWFPFLGGLIMATTGSITTYLEWRSRSKELC